MADLTEDQQRAFGNRIAEMLNDPDTKAALVAAGSTYDPAPRGARVAQEAKDANASEQKQTKKKSELKDATTETVANTTVLYTDASGAADTLVGELGRNHSLSHEIRQMRTGMINVAARGPHTAAPAPSPINPPPPV